MLKDESPKEEKQETLEELSEALFLVQEMGRRLAHEVHGEVYDSVRELNELLHQCRVQVATLEKKLGAET